MLEGGVKPLNEEDLNNFYLEVMLAFYVLMWGAIVCCFLMYNRPTVYAKMTHIFNNLILVMLMCVNWGMHFEFDTETYMTMFYIPYWGQIVMVILTFFISIPTILFPKALENEIRMLQRYKFYTLMVKITFIIIYFNFFIRIWLLSLIYGGFDWDYIDTPSIDWIVLSLWPYALTATVGSWLVLYYLDWVTVKRFVDRLRQFYKYVQNGAKLSHRLSRLFGMSLQRRGSRSEISPKGKEKVQVKD